MALIYMPKQAVGSSEPTPTTLATPREPVDVDAPVVSIGNPGHRRDITYRQPALHSEARVDPSFNDRPLSHRARKQVYMASALFDAGGPRGEAIYTPSRQNAVYSDLRRTLEQVSEQPNLQLPSPADFRATVNAGQGAVIPRQKMAASNDLDFVSFGGGPDVAIVHASRDESSLPREFWATSSSLQWHDPRAEFCGARKPQAVAPVNEPPPGSARSDSADARKRREMSSEVFGSQRRIQKSTSTPSRELWSQTQKYFSSQDSRLGPRTLTIPEEDASSVDGDSTARAPMTARARLSRNLSESNESQFAGRYPQLSRREAAASESPGPGRRTQRGVKESDNSFEVRRRSERNYSDLFGNQTAAATPRAEGQRRRSEFNSTSNCSFLDPQVEIGNRNVAKGERIAPATPREASQSVVLPGPSAGEISSRASLQDSAVREEERACWDTTNIMQANSEIARRTRQSRSHSAGRRDVDVAEIAGNRSAGERKRLDLSSGQFRKSNGYAPQTWDDGRKGPGPAGMMPTPITRSNPGSPLGAPWRNVPLNSAKQRRIMSLMSSVVF